MEKVTLEELLKLDITNKVICFPTDTVYGVGALVKDVSAVQRIYQMKRRSNDKPLAILTGTKDIEKYVKNVTKEARRLMDEGWPGALTLIFEKSDDIDDEITQGFKTIAFRMPNSKVALTILNHFGLMAVTSVNFSGQKELSSVKDIEETFSDWIDYIVTDEEKFSSVPSKIIDVTKDEIKIIRN